MGDRGRAPVAVVTVLSTWLMWNDSDLTAFPVSSCSVLVASVDDALNELILEF